MIHDAGDTGLYSLLSLCIFALAFPFFFFRNPPLLQRRAILLLPKLSEIRRALEITRVPVINLKFETRLRFLLIEGEYIYFISSRISLLIWSIWARKIVAICLPTRCFFSLCTISHKNCRRERKPAG